MRSDETTMINCGRSQIGDIVVGDPDRCADAVQSRVCVHPIGRHQNMFRFHWQFNWNENENERVTQ
jgi:hypothetical protein